MYAKENRDRKEKNIDLDNQIYYLQQNFIIEIHCNTFKTTKQKSTENKRFCIQNLFLKVYFQPNNKLESGCGLPGLDFEGTKFIKFEIY